MAMLSDFDLGYFAGILEGEGSLVVRADVRADGVKLSNSIDASVQIGNDSPQLMRWLVSRLGGKAVWSGPSQTFTWVGRKNEVEELLQRVKPFLVFKKAQCDSFLRILQTLRPLRSGVPLQEEELTARDSLCIEHSGLIKEPWEVNKKGREKQSVLMSLSGGADSTTLLYYLRQKGLKVEAISFDYGQRHSKELEFARKICEELSVKHDVVSLPITSLIPSSLTADIPVPEGHYETETMKQTVVPNRNAILLSIVAGAAIARGIPNVAYAAHGSDSAIYPDCRPAFAYMLEQAMKWGNWEDLSLLCPFLSFTKTDVIFTGSMLGVPYEKTWSCYRGEERPCLRCGTDVERTESFFKAGLKDPLLTEEEWQSALKYLGEVSA